MASAGGLEAPLVDGSTGSAKWRRSVVKVVVATTACALIAMAAFYFVFPLSGVEVQSTLAEKKMMQTPKTVPEFLKLHPKPESIRQINEFFKHLPAHDMEDVVYKHIKPHAKKLFHSFLQYFGSTAPHFKTGEKLSRRYKLEDQDEFAYRLGVFEGVLRDIIRLNNYEAHHNLRSDRAVFAVTKFADWSWAEFQTLLKGPATKLNTTISSKTLTTKASSDAKWGTLPPCTKNWAAEHPDVFKPRSQGSCGSCYAHAAAEEMRAVTFVNTGHDVGELSVQFIIDCLRNGCNGGDAGNTMDWIKRQGGIPTKANYGPYNANSQTCKAGIPKSVTTTGASHFYGEEETANKLCSDGPLSMGVHVNDAFRSYHSGVLSSAACPAIQPNHDTQVVAVLRDKRAFLIRNSWGSNWGVSASTFEPGDEAGFILLEYGHNTCDLTDLNSFPEGAQCVGSCTGQPTTPPSPPPPTPSNPVGTYCTNTCKYNDDGACDDGGDGSAYSLCPLGSDCDDCGPREGNFICEDSCRYASDGDCDDGGSGSWIEYCHYGSDCEDCGPRPALRTCNDNCRWANDGECDEPILCERGTDCTDCQR